MRIISVNTNGIRAANRKGFFDWLKKQKADVVCIQETKAQVHQLEDEVFHPQGYHCYYHDAVKKGYSGVAVFCKKKPKKVHAGIGMHDIDVEGRYIEVEFEKISVISLYMHSGSSSEERQELKFDFMGRFMTYLHKLRRKRREFVICGDWNIAHKQSIKKTDTIKTTHTQSKPEGVIHCRAYVADLYLNLGLLWCV